MFKILNKDYCGFSTKVQENIYELSDLKTDIIIKTKVNYVNYIQGVPINMGIQ